MKTQTDLGARWCVWSTPRPRRFTFGEEIRYQLYRRLGGSHGRSEEVRKASAPPGFDPRVVQPVDCRFTDWAIPAPVCVYVCVCIYMYAYRGFNGGTLGTHLVAWMSSFRRYDSDGSACCRLRYSATCLAGNSVSQTYPKSLARWIASPAKQRNARVSSLVQEQPRWFFAAQDVVTSLICGADNFAFPSTVLTLYNWIHYLLLRTALLST